MFVPVPATTKPDELPLSAGPARALLGLDALLGILVLRGRWREAMTLEHAHPR